MTDHSFSWKSLSEAKIEKGLDYSSFEYNTSVIPQAFYSFFGIGGSYSEKEINLIFNTQEFTAKIKWSRLNTSPVARISWKSTLTDLLKKTYPEWKHVKQNDKPMNMKLLLEKTGSNTKYRIELNSSMIAKNWSEEELSTTLESYFEMLARENRGEKFNKKSFYEELSSKYGRTPKSYEYRMQNFSYVFSLLGRKWVKGLKPAKNVGTKVIERIERLIQLKEASELPLTATFHNKVEQLRKQKRLDMPSGNLIPEKKESKATSFLRNPNVVAWILKEANGVCEVCDYEAPFYRSDGAPFLEIHHLKRLADKGPDVISNALAACPNCHRELHYGEKKELLLEKLYAKISRLQKV